LIHLEQERVVFSKIDWPVNPVQLFGVKRDGLGGELGIRGVVAALEVKLYVVYADDSGLEALIAGI